MPENVVVIQRQAMVDSHRTLKAEGFPEVVFSDSVYRLRPFLERLSGTRQADFGLDGSDGLGELNLVRRTFGEEILPLWRWKPGSNVAAWRPCRADPPRSAVPHPRPAHRRGRPGRHRIRRDGPVPAR